MEEKTYQIYKLKNVKYIFSIEKGGEINYTLDVYEYICSFNIKREHELLKEHTGTERDNKFLENEFMKKYETHTDKRKNRIRGFNELNEIFYRKKTRGVIDIDDESDGETNYYIKNSEYSRNAYQ